MNPVTVSYDLSPAMVESKLRDALIGLGWTPPGVTFGPTARPDMRASTQDVIAERIRQIVSLGRDAAHDDAASQAGDLACVAACYALNATGQLNRHAKVHKEYGRPLFWPQWDAKHWKPKDARRDLVRAGALILAEIDRIDRQQAKAAG